MAEINAQYPPDMTAHVHLRDFMRAFTIKSADGRILHHGQSGFSFEPELDNASAVVAFHLSSRGRWAVLLPGGDYAAVGTDGSFFTRRDHDDTSARFLFRETPQGGYFVANGDLVLTFSDTPHARGDLHGAQLGNIGLTMERITRVGAILKATGTGLTRFGAPEDELVRFRNRVAALRAAGDPVKIYAGSGLTIRPGFLNIDLKMPTSNLVVEEELPNLFRFPIDGHLPIDDKSVDYVLSEDFFEHIPQLVQIKFLAEMRRVLKPGAINRVNTPCLAASMAKHSRFDRGSNGVHENEWLRWGHVNIMTAGTLKEFAEIVGYADCVFTRRDEGTSIFHDGCIRPKLDRDHVTGNIYADLVA